jgi:Rps23 Pro-64 3,4-dihydroxylase Tpa1-like proline 4-hydroxylase
MIDLQQSGDLRSDPFAHTTAQDLLPLELASFALSWMETAAPWKLRIASFYEQWELHLDSDSLPSQVRALCARSTVERLSNVMLRPLTAATLVLTEVTAHKLVAGQTIRLHNDHLDGEETHRLIVQLNRGWDDEQGGMLMLFSGPSPEEVCRIIRPIHRSALAFPITPRSFHAVSTIRTGERYTLVYSFRETTH